MSERIYHKVAVGRESFELDARSVTPSVTAHQVHLIFLSSTHPPNIYPATGCLLFLGTRISSRSVMGHMVLFARQMMR